MDSPTSAQTLPAATLRTRVHFAAASALDAQWRNLYLRRFGCCAYPPLGSDEDGAKDIGAFGPVARAHSWRDLVQWRLDTPCLPFALLLSDPAFHAAHVSALLGVLMQRHWHTLFSEATAAAATAARAELPEPAAPPPQPTKPGSPTDRRPRRKARPPPAPITKIKAEELVKAAMPSHGRRVGVALEAPSTEDITAEIERGQTALPFAPRSTTASPASTRRTSQVSAASGPTTRRRSTLRPGLSLGRIPSSLLPHERPLTDASGGSQLGSGTLRSRAETPRGGGGPESTAAPPGALDRTARATDFPPALIELASSDSDGEGDTDDQRPKRQPQTSQAPSFIGDISAGVSLTGRAGIGRGSARSAVPAPPGTAPGAMTPRARARRTSTGSISPAEISTGLPRRRSAFSVWTLPAMALRPYSHDVNPADTTTRAPPGPRGDGLRRKLWLEENRKAHAQLTAAVDDTIVLLEGATPATLGTLAAVLARAIDDVPISEADYVSIPELIPPVPQRVSATADPHDVGSQLRQPPVLAEPHPLLMPFTVFASYADLHAPPVLREQFAPLFAFLADPTHMLYEDASIAPPAAVPARLARQSTATPQHRRSSVGRGPRRQYSPAVSVTAPPLQASEARRQFEDAVSDCILDATSVLVRVLHDASQGPLCAPGSNPPDPAQDPPPRPPQWLPPSVAYLAALITAKVNARGVALVTHGEPAGQRDANGRRRAQFSGSAASLFPAAGFDLGDAATTFAGATNPVLQNILSCRTATTLLIDGMIAKYIADPTFYAMLPPSITALPPHHHLRRHAQHNCLAFASYLRTFVSGETVTAFFVVDEGSSANAASPVHATSSVPPTPSAHEGRLSRAPSTLSMAGPSRNQSAVAARARSTVSQAQHGPIIGSTQHKLGRELPRLTSASVHSTASPQTPMSSPQDMGRVPSHPRLSSLNRPPSFASIPMIPGTDAAHGLPSPAESHATSIQPPTPMSLHSGTSARSLGGGAFDVVSPNDPLLPATAVELQLRRDDVRRRRRRSDTQPSTQSLRSDTTPGSSVTAARDIGRSAPRPPERWLGAVRAQALTGWPAWAAIFASDVGVETPARHGPLLRLLLEHWCLAVVAPLNDTCAAQKAVASSIGSFTTSGLVPTTASGVEFAAMAASSSVPETAVVPKRIYVTEYRAPEAVLADAAKNLRGALRGREHLFLAEIEAGLAFTADGNAAAAKVSAEGRAGAVGTGPAPRADAAVTHTDSFNARPQQLHEGAVVAAGLRLSLNEDMWTPGAEHPVEMSASLPSPLRPFRALQGGDPMPSFGADQKSAAAPRPVLLPHHIPPLLARAKAVLQEVPYSDNVAAILAGHSVRRVPSDSEGERRQSSVSEGPEQESDSGGGSVSDLASSTSTTSSPVKRRRKRKGPGSPASPRPRASPTPDDDGLGSSQSPSPRPGSSLAASGTFGGTTRSLSASRTLMPVAPASPPPKAKRSAKKPASKRSRAK